MKNMIKRETKLDIVLVVLGMFLLIFCCDVPVCEGFELFDNTGKDFFYDLSMAALTAIIMYFLQKGHGYLSVTLKYEKIVYNECQKIANHIKDIIYSITKERDCYQLTEQLLEAKLKKVDFHNTGSTFSLKNEEIVVIDSIIYNNLKLLEKVDNLMSLPSLDKEMFMQLYKLKTLDINDIWREIYENKEGDIITVNEKHGMSLGGCKTYSFKDHDIVNGIMQYINIINTLNRTLECVYGYTCGVKL